MSAVNVASIAIISTIGVNYFLDKVRDRQEKNMREEIKDRIESTLKESLERIRSLEQEADSFKHQLVSREQVDRLVNDKLEDLQNGKAIGDAKNRALNLKLRANQASHPSQAHQHPKRTHSMFQEEPDKDPVKEELDQIKLEMVRELRDIKQHIKEAT